MWKKRKDSKSKDEVEYMKSQIKDEEKRERLEIIKAFNFFICTFFRTKKSKVNESENPFLDCYFE
nr:hypothetical protein [Staphylococcus aureus]